MIDKEEKIGREKEVRFGPPLKWYGFGPIARYETCPTSVVWATDEGFIDQMGSLT